MELYILALDIDYKMESYIIPFKEIMMYQDSTLVEGLNIK